jgi:arylsulfatase A-like enzyme
MKRWALAVAVTLFVAVGFFRSIRAPRAAVRHAVLITVDTLRPDRMSLYGYERETTPNIDRYFTGFAFDNARSTAPCTLPAVKQMLTGRLDMQGRTIAQTLEEHGMTTAAVVSQHWFVGDELYRAGFDHWDVQSESDRDHHGLSRRRARDVTDRALRWLDTEGAKGERLFLWVHYFDPHDPYDPPRESRHFAQGITRFADGDRRAAQLAAWTDEEKWFLVDSIFDDDDRDALSRLYDDEILCLDHEIGRLLDGLDTRSLLRDAVVILSADHGERLGEDGAWDHCYSLHDYELRVPLAVRTPSAEFDRHPAASTLDIYPTILEATGVTTSTPLMGTTLFGARAHAITVSAFERRLAVADAGWKLYLDCGAEGCEPSQLVRLHDGTEIGGESVPLGDAVLEAERLSAALGSHELALGRAFEITEQEFERLRSIGYVR